MRRAVRGSLTAALLVGGSWGLAPPTAATTAAHAEDPVTAETFAIGEPFAAGEPFAISEPFAAGEPFAGRRTWDRNHESVYGSWPAGPPGAWTSPVPTHRVSAPYGIRGDWKAGHHTGIDFAVPVGTPVRSVGSGRVVFAGWSGDYGKAVTVRMDDGHYTVFAHLSEIRVEKGDRVKAGTLLGESGNTGRSSGPHLHFEVRSGRAYGTDVNPVAYLEQHGVRIF